jgi:hypothetical protein
MFWLNLAEIVPETNAQILTAAVRPHDLFHVRPLVSL